MDPDDTGETAFEITAEIEALHGELSRHNVEFLRYVERHSECLQRSTFAELQALERRDGYPMQFWPTFVRRDVLQRLGQINADLCTLIKSVPIRVFEAETGRLAEFYGLDEDHARIVAAGLRNRAWVAGTFARSDFIHTAAGFKCLELNVGGNLGGWQNSAFSTDVLATPTVARFVAEAGIEARTVDALSTMMSFVLGRALRRFRSKEVNIGLLFEEIGGASLDLLEAADERYRTLLRRIGGLQGKLLRCRYADLGERGGKLYAGETRLHALVDGVGHAPGMDTVQCWLRGALDFYGDPMSPCFTDKRNLALLSELADTELFGNAEKALIRTAVPWTRRVSEVPIGKSRPPVERRRLLAERPRLVLKPGTGLAGVDVHLGVTATRDRWERLVDRAFEEGHWVAQELQESLSYLYLGPEGGGVLHDVVWSFFIFGETPGGWYLRMAPSDRKEVINATRGAQAGSILEVDA